MGSSNAGLTTSLRSLVSALQTNQATMSYLSDNITNVNTVGYTRRIVSQETQVSSGSGVGVNINQVRRSIDEFLLNSVRTQLSKVGETNITNTYLDRLQNFTFGDPNSKFTINNSMSEFYSRLENFSNNPSSAVNRNLVINSAKDFTNSITELSKAIQSERLNADTELKTSVDTLNTLLNNLGDINKALRQSAAVGGDKQSLEDARDLQLSRLKDLISADLSFDTFGEVSVSLSSTELLGYSQKYTIDYTRQSSVDNFINGVPMNAITVSALDANGNKTGKPATLLSESDATDKIDNIPSGKIRGLIDLRDTKLPAILSQLDTFAYTFADAFNESHNSGTGFPPARTLTGTESFALEDSRLFTGQARIALTDDNGQPVTGRYGEKVTPLVLDFDRFNGQDGFGTASVNDIVSEINRYYGTQPSNIVNIGSAKDIKLGAVSSAITSVKATGSIGFSGQPSDNDTLIINGTTVTFKNTPALSTDVQIGSSIFDTLENLTTLLNTSSDTNISQATYSASGTTLSVTSINSGTTGNSFTLDAAGTSVASASGTTLSGGADASGNFTFDFDFSNLSAAGNDITFDVTQLKVNSGAFSAATFNTYTQAAGERFRTNKSTTSNDTASVSLTGLGLEQGDTFTITATINVVEGGITKTEDVTFTLTVPDPDADIKNTRYDASAVSGTADGEIVAGDSSVGFISASLVDANGTPITDTTTKGFLKLTTTSSSFRISIDQLNSKEVGDATTSNPTETATNRGFSHLFGLNNFFDFGGSITNSATSLKVRDDIVTSPSLLSSGKVRKSVSLGGDAVYTFEVGSGSNESILDMLAVQDTNLKFGGTGTLPELTTTASSYITEIYNYSASQATNAKAEADKNNLLKDALETKVDEIGGVNLDEELGKTIEIQNAYSAAAKVLSIVRELFQKIEESLA